MLAAIAAEAEGHRALLAGDPGAAEAYARAADGYAASWAAAPPRSYGRLVGRVKAVVLAGDADAAARDVLVILAGDPDADGSPVAAYARAVAALVPRDDATALAAVEGMRAGSSEAAGRAADGIEAIARGDGAALAAALAAIEADFAAREEHLTGVAIADTAIMLERIASARGMAAR
jgi:hypothetical protein